MKEQIEEMRKEVASIHRFFMEDDDYEDLDDYIADELYNAGYRKQSEGEWIFRNDGAYGRTRCYCSACGKHSGIGGIRENQLKPFCPNCGAHMKGGDKP